MKLEAEIEVHLDGGPKNSIGKILLIEDEVELLDALVAVLKDHHYEVTGLTSATEGIECLRRETYDILISDLMMPEMDGLDLLRRALQLDHDLVCIMITGHGTIQSAVEAMKIGAFDYVLKPFRVGSITPVLTRALSLRRQRLEKVRRELDEQRIRLQNVVANVPGVVWEVWGDPNSEMSRWSFVSDYIREMLGYSIQEWLTPSSFWLSVVHPDDRERALKETNEVFLNGGCSRSEFRCLTRDKRVIWVEANYAAIKGEDGKSVGMRGVSIDITARKHTEEQLRQSQKMEAIGQLAGGVAHDFNNLLTAINGYSELALRRMKPEDPLTKNLEEIKRAGNRAASLTRQLLAFSRKQVVEPCILDLNTIVVEVEKMLRRLIGEHIELRTELAPSLGTVKADPGQMEQVLMNLAVNARDAMPEGGKLVIQTANVVLDSADIETGANSGPHVMLAMTDSGCGMSRETQAHIFEPFFTTKGKGRGTGLGLSMVYGIVQQFNGCICVESEEGKGTTFKIYLPQVNRQLVDKCEAKTVPRKIEGSETVLVVEDEEIVRNLAKQILRLHGYSVLEAANGGAALRICEHHNGPIQLLLSDVIMPEMGGVELSTRLSSIRPDMKILFMSGYTENVVLDNFLQKPFSHHDLVSKVREVLDERGN